MCDDHIGIYLFLVGNPKDQLVPVSVPKVRCKFILYPFITPRSLDFIISFDFTRGISWEVCYRGGGFARGTRGSGSHFICGY